MRLAAPCKKDIDNQPIRSSVASRFALHTAHCYPNGPNNGRTVHDQQDVRIQRGPEPLLMEQNYVEWVLGV